MTLSEYYKIPRGEQNNMKIGDRFRPPAAKESGVKIGELVGFYEVIAVKASPYVTGYEVMLSYDKIEKNETREGVNK